MSNTRVKFIQTTSETLDSIPVRAGTIYFVTDTQKIYMDSIDGTRTEYSSTSSSTLPAYGVCSTASNVADKVVTIASGFILETGADVRIKFENFNEADRPTLNINNTGAKPIVFSNDAEKPLRTMTGWYAGSVVEFTYDGSSYIINNINCIPNELVVGENVFFHIQDLRYQPGQVDDPPAHSISIAGGQAIGANSIAVNGGEATGHNSIAIGEGAQADANGYAIGRYTFARPGQIVLGTYNDPSRASSAELVVGSGSYDHERNALEVHSDGELICGIGTYSQLYQAIVSHGLGQSVTYEEGTGEYYLNLFKLLASMIEKLQ